MLKENASAVYPCQDGYADSKLRAVWVWPTCSQQTVDQWSMVPKLDLTLNCLFTSLADVNGAYTSHLPVQNAAGVWPLWQYLPSESALSVA